MRYRDPEAGRGMPSNFDSRWHDTRPRHRRRDDGRDSGRWERGVDARPQFARGERDTDRWDHGGFRGDRDGGRDRGRECDGDRRRDDRRDGGSLADRLGDRAGDRAGPSGGLNYGDEADERERAEDKGRMAPGRAARADAWLSAAAMRRSVSPPRRRPSLSMRRSPSRERGATPASDMVMDDD
jgi:hypothetical protein